MLKDKKFLLPIQGCSGPRYAVTDRFPININTRGGHAPKSAHMTLETVKKISSRIVMDNGAQHEQIFT